MVGEDTVIMSVKELRRVPIIRHAMEKKLTQGQAGALLNLTARHVRRLITRVRAEDDAGLAHRGRGQPSNRRHAPALKTRVLRLYAQHDRDFGPWLEGRGPRCVLMAYLDEASSRVSARFYEYEGTVPALDSFGRYVTQHGIPLAVYADKHTTYKSPAQPTMDEQLAGRKAHSQFERSLSELGVELITRIRLRPRDESSACLARSRIG